MTAETQNWDWIDAHLHAESHMPLAVLDSIDAMERRNGYAGWAFASLAGSRDPTQNAIALYLKWRFPNAYALAGFDYQTDYGPGSTPAGEILELIEIGCDGVKCIEQKPTTRIRLGLSPLDPIFDEALTALEARDIPVLMHVGDPPTFWDPERVPDWARANGWFYAEGDFVDLEELYAEHAEMLARHPGLRVLFAHFFFMSPCPDRLADWLRRFPNMNVDVTSGSEMYYDFSRDPAFWRGFMREHSGRIIYGTDSVPAARSDSLPGDAINRMQREMLSRTGPVLYDGDVLEGIGLDSGTLRAITRENAMRFLGAKPKPVDRERAVAWLDRLLIHAKTVNRELVTAIRRKIAAGESAAAAE
ncbi:MAG: amidohydrolase family protein [Bacillota bacterium]|nr:amidohydrolase family protein [Bacillota bacterium]